MDDVLRFFLNAVLGLAFAVVAMLLTLLAGDPFRFETPPIPEELARRTLTEELAETRWQGFSDVARFTRTLRGVRSHREPFELASGECAAVVVATHGEQVPIYLHVVPRDAEGSGPYPSEALASQRGSEHVALQTQLCMHEPLELDLVVVLEKLERRRAGDTTLHVALAIAPRETLIGELRRGEVRRNHLWAAPPPRTRVPDADVDSGVRE
ncbi:MAG: hypothetical protein MUE69_26550 [Myxococcota bacterium]|jgi:hypothetical protein|nr:hypothetical protein [Myxococcota bacterium]